MDFTIIPTTTNPSNIIPFCRNPYYNSLVYYPSRDPYTKLVPNQ